jgi:hypothetical protein
MNLDPGLVFVISRAAPAIYINRMNRKKRSRYDPVILSLIWIVESLDCGLFLDSDCVIKTPSEEE